MEDRQIERLRALKDRRDNEVVRSCLLSVEKAARNDENTIPSMIEAVKQYATIGEICGVLREVYGSYQDPAQF
jgi:methylmalonyl-CoA mutase N-terminal domain/subunit